MSSKRPTENELNQKKELIRRAEGKLKLAAARLMDKYPFHAAVVNRMPMIAKEGTGTLAVTFGQDTVLLLFEPQFVLNLPLKQLVGGLQHEVHHIIFHHLLMYPKDYPNRDALVIAQEVTVNEFVKEPLPEWVISLDKYPDLPPMESTVERYKRLDKAMPQLPIPGGNQGPPTGSGGDSEQDNKGKKEDGKADVSQKGKVFDNHSEWDKKQEGGGGESKGDNKGDNKQSKEEILEDLIQEAIQDTPPELIPAEIKEACQTHGSIPGGLFEMVSRGKASNCWELLRKYAGQETAIRPVFTRPPRRFPDLVGIFPAYARQADKPRIMAVLDTSGSITSGMLSQMDANLRILSRDHDILIVECDVVIYRTYKFKGLKEVMGRGGTDLRPPLEEKFLKLHKPDLVIYFTDGWGDAPEKKPIVPMIWAILPFGQVPAPYGKVVFLK